jgi:hypothetical protein
MSISPTEHFLLLLAFQSTRSELFDIQTIRQCLDIATANALVAKDSEEFRLLLEQLVEGEQGCQTDNPATPAGVDS